MDEQLEEQEGANAHQETQIIARSQTAAVNGTTRLNTDVPNWWVQELKQTLCTTKLFAHAAADTQDALSKAYSQHFQRQSLSSPQRRVRSTNYFEVFPKVGSKHPTLLSELALKLGEEMRAAEKLAVLPHVQHLKKQHPNMSQNLWLHVQRQIFRAFLSKFASYEAFLTTIKDELDHTLREGLQCALQNVSMREDTSRVEELRLMAADGIRAEIAAGEAIRRKDLHMQLLELRGKAAKIEQRTRNAERDLQSAKQEQLRLQKQVFFLRKRQQQLQELVTAEESWQAKAAGNNALSRLQIGPMSAQEEEMLASELEVDVSSTSRSNGRPVNSLFRHGSIIHPHMHRNSSCLVAAMSLDEDTLSEM